MSFTQFEEAFCLEVLLADLLKLEAFRLQFKSVLVLHVLLDAHSENVLVHWQLNLSINLIDLLLFALEQRFHLIDPDLVLLLDISSGTYFLDEARLVTSTLVLDRLKVGFEVFEKL